MRTGIRAGWVGGVGWVLAIVLWGCSRNQEPSVVAAPVGPPDVVTGALDPALAAAIGAARRQVVTNLPSGSAWGGLGLALDAADFSSEAQICYREAAVREPDSARWLHLLALRQLPEQPALGLQNLQAAVRRSGVTNDASRLRLAQAFWERGRFAESTNVLRSLLGAVPDHAAARLELARISLATGSLEGLPTLLAPCLTNPYTARPAHLLLGQVLLRTGQPEAAARHAQWGATLPKPFDWPDPFLRQVQEMRRDGRKMAEQANQLLTQKRLPEAESLLTNLLARRPEDGEGLLLLGRIRLQQRRCDEAEALFERFLGQRSDSPNGWVQLGMARYCQSRWADAAIAFEQAVQRKSDFAQAHFNLGLARSRLGDSVGAMASFREALRCSPGDAGTHASLAEELFRAGDIPQAIQQVNQALSLEPKHPRARALRDRLESSEAIRK